MTFGAYLTDIYALGRLTEKPYITRAYMYAGLAHALNYAITLGHDFGFKVTAGLPDQTMLMLNNGWQAWEASFTESEYRQCAVVQSPAPNFRLLDFSSPVNGIGAAFRLVLGQQILYVIAEAGYRRNREVICPDSFFNIEVMQYIYHNATGQGRPIEFYLVADSNSALRHSDMHRRSY